MAAESELWVLEVTCVCGCPIGYHGAPGGLAPWCENYEICGCEGFRALVPEKTASEDVC